MQIKESSRTKCDKSSCKWTHRRYLQAETWKEVPMTECSVASYADLTLRDSEKETPFDSLKIIVKPNYI